MSVLTSQFNYELDQSSKVQVDYERVVNHDEDGNEVITYEPVDYPSQIKSRGKAEDWNLNNLLKAGINPNFPIYTGYTTRLQGIDEIGKADAYAAEITKEETTKNEE